MRDVTPKRVGNSTSFALRSELKVTRPITNATSSTKFSSISFSKPQNIINSHKRSMMARYNGNNTLTELD